ncbi:MAG: hypothetical protein V3V31_12750, partial [Methylococcales bacterium]
VVMKIIYYTVIYISIMFASHQVISAETAKIITTSQNSVKTAKEKLGKKYSDNQRVNNCKVPVEKRGSKRRSVKCVRRKP